jgi:putative transcriptional regulator
VHIGGPVQPEELQVVELGEAPAPESVALASGVHVGGRWDSLESMLVRPAPSLRLFLGYAGWGPGQLEDEVAEGAWDVWSVDLRRLLETPEELWATSPEALRRFLTKEERGA